MKFIPVLASRALMSVVLCALALVPVQLTAASAVAALEPPVIEYPEDGARFTEPVQQASGRGIPGAVINVTGSSLQSTPVQEDGTFVVGFLPPLFIGSHSLTMTQTVDGETSEAAVVSFAVVPPPPTIDAPANGATFAPEQAPTSLSGTAVGGGVIRVTVNGAVQADEAESNQGWTLTLDQPLAPGENTITAVHELGDVASDPTTITVTVLSPAPGPAPPSEPATPGAAPRDQSPPTTDALAESGENLALPLLMAGALLAVGVATVVAVSRRRSKARS